MAPSVEQDHGTDHGQYQPGRVNQGAVRGLAEQPRDEAADKGSRDPEHAGHQDAQVVEPDMMKRAMAPTTMPTMNIHVTCNMASLLA